MITLVIVNQSALVADDEGQRVVAAVQRQVTEHFAAAWGTAAVLHYVPKGQTPPDGWRIVLSDSIDVGGALGYHEDKGDPWGIVDVKLCGDDNVPWSRCLSHEVLETLGDPLATICVDALDGRVFALEVCDAVENFQYEIDGVVVSDFVFPAYFHGGSTGPWDFLSVLTAPLTLAPGGYSQVGQISNWGSINAEGVRPSRAQPRPGSRAWRRLRGASCAQ